MINLHFNPLLQDEESDEEGRVDPKKHEGGGQYGVRNPHEMEQR